MILCDFTSHSRRLQQKVTFSVSYTKLVICISGKTADFHSFSTKNGELQGFIENNNNKIHVFFGCR